MTLRPRPNETFWRLLQWSNSKEDAERLATQILQHSGYHVDPSHPRGGPDGGADGIVRKRGPHNVLEAARGVMAVYFPSGAQPWAAIKRKLVSDADGVAANDATYLVFVTNQSITIEQRKEAAAVLPMSLELFHVEDLVTVLDDPGMASVRLQYLGISTLPDDDGEPLPVLPRRPSPPPSRFDLTIDLHGETIGASELLARGQRRLAIVGEAGVGKTHVLQELAATAPPATVVVFVDLARWDLEQVPAFAPEWDAARRLGALLKCSDAVSREHFERFARSDATLLIVDGVNELLDPDLMTDITALLEGLSDRWPNLAIVLASRADTGGVGRPLRPRRFGKPWEVGFVRRLPVGRVQHAIDKQYGAGTWEGLSGRAQAVLEIPFFLRRVLDGTDPTAGSRSAALGAFFEHQIDLSDAVLDQIGRGLFASYGRALRQASLATLDEATVATLVDAGVWGRRDERALFTHQLYGDYLVSRCLADDEELWTTPNFDAVTFGVQARDPVLLAAEQLAPTARIDGFIRAVYNWHWASAVECLLAAEAIEHHRVSPAIHTMVVALLSERRGDAIGGTGDRAKRLLSQVTGPLAAELADLHPEQTPARIAKITYNNDRPYVRWHRVFCRELDTPWSESDLAGIAVADALHGWTVSNVLRRTAFDESVASPLRALYRAESGSAITRWRIVHALGRSVSRPTLELLVDALATDEFWVRFGAVRAIVEIAAQTDDPALRTDALENLRTLLPQQTDTIADMAVWTAMYEGADPDFHDQVLALFTAIQGLQTDAAARDRWGDRISDLADYRAGERQRAYRAAATYGQKE